MAVDKLVDSTQLDSDLTSVANAIRTKGGTSASLAFPSGFITAINNISGGGTAAISVVDTADSGGGTVRTITALDISDTTATASDVASGKYFYTADGTKTTGTASSTVVMTDVSNATGTTLAVSGDNVTGQHSIYFEFSDSTNTTITVYYTDAILGTMITSYTPTTYGNKTVTLAQLDGVTWYQPSNIPIGVELMDLAEVTNDYVINSSGEAVAEQWYSASDYAPIASGMSFSYSGCRWFYLAFYDSSKQFISSIYIDNDTTESTYNTNVGDGTLSGSEIPSNAAFIRITSVYNPDSNHYLSLIRTA